MILPLVALDRRVLVAVDIVAWGVVHAGTGYLAHRLPDSCCDHDSGVFRIRRWERSGKLWRLLRVHRWKDRVPEAGGFFAGGTSKRTLPSSTDAGLVRFASLTRRAELAHWFAALAAPVFLLWNPLWITGLMVIYGVLVNAPFVVIQRYNRWRVLGILARRSSRSSSDGPDRARARSRSAEDTTGSSMP